MKNYLYSALAAVAGLAGAGAVAYAGSITVQVLVGRAADAEGRGRPRVGAAEWWGEARAFLSISRFALVAALGQSFVVNGDRLVLGAAGSSAQVGIYAAASSLAQVAWVAPVALAPMLTRRVAEAGTLVPWRHMYPRVLALTGVLAVAVASLGWFVIPILLGDAFTPARDVLPILCAAALPYAGYQVDAAACAGLRDLRTGALGALVGCLALVAATTAGYHAFDTAGIAWGVLLAYVVMAGVSRWRVARHRSRVTNGTSREERP